MKKYLIANWKMNLSLSDSIRLAQSLSLVDFDPNLLELVVAPSFTALSEVVKNLQDARIKVAGQNLYSQNQGAFTGEISASMLKELGCKYVIIGHSERRHIIGESDREINQKIKISLENNLMPIVCVGETLEQKESGQTSNIVSAQLRAALDSINQSVIVAYEPVWAIGTGHSCNPNDAASVAELVRNITPNIVLYGGSVSPDNINSYILPGVIDGVLVGGASQKEKTLLELIKKLDN